MKTAVDWLVDHLYLVIPNEERDFLEGMRKEALEKEKKQIMNAYSDGAKGGANGTKGQHEFGWVSIQTKEKYYNQTYKPETI